LAVGEVDGEAVIVTHIERDGEWKPEAAIRLEFADQRVARITDYLHCPWILTPAISLVAGQPFPH
jgi:hypothetical protein